MTEIRDNFDNEETGRLVLDASGYEELPIGEIENFPMLSKCYCAWKSANRRGNLPASIEFDRLPQETIPYVMLLDFLPEEKDVLVRLAGNFVGERTSADRDGLRLDNFFSSHDAQIVYSSMEQVALSQAPSLARRRYVSIDGKSMSYVRLILPLSVDGDRVTGFFKTIEPDTLIIK